MGGTGAGFARPYYGQAAVIRLIRPERTDTGSVIVGKHLGSGVAGQIDGGVCLCGYGIPFPQIRESAISVACGRPNRGYSVYPALGFTPASGAGGGGRYGCGRVASNRQFASTGRDIAVLKKKSTRHDRPVSVPDSSNAASGPP
jgi:hypothetical protein